MRRLWTSDARGSHPYMIRLPRSSKAYSDDRDRNPISQLLGKRAIQIKYISLLAAHRFHLIEAVCSLPFYGLCRSKIGRHDTIFIRVFHIRAGFFHQTPRKNVAVPCSDIDIEAWHMLSKDIFEEVFWGVILLFFEFSNPIIGMSLRNSHVGSNERA